MFLHECVSVHRGWREYLGRDPGTLVHPPWRPFVPREQCMLGDTGNRAYTRYTMAHAIGSLSDWTHQEKNSSKHQLIHLGYLFNIHIYRPQTKFAKVMFLHVCVCPQGVGEYLGRDPGTRYTPPLGPGPPGSSACWEIRATSGRHASYWNAFLLILHSFSYYFLKKSLLVQRYSWVLRSEWLLSSSS